MEKIRKNNLSELVYQKIREIIATRYYEPGQRVNKRELAEMLEVSQTPVNEAVTRFISEGLMEQKGRGGIFLKVYTYQDVKDLYAVRAGLEGISLRLCIEDGQVDKLDDAMKIFENMKRPLSFEEKKAYPKMDRAFHLELLFSSNNKVISEFNSNYVLILKSYQMGFINDPEESLSEHLEIIRAIREEDALAAQVLLIEHHLKARNNIAKYF